MTLNCCCNSRVEAAASGHIPARSSHMSSSLSSICRPLMELAGKKSGIMSQRAMPALENRSQATPASIEHLQPLKSRIGFLETENLFCIPTDSCEALWILEMFSPGSHLSWRAAGINSAAASLKKNKSGNAHPGTAEQKSENQGHSFPSQCGWIEMKWKVAATSTARCAGVILFLLEPTQWLWHCSPFILFSGGKRWLCPSLHRVLGAKTRSVRIAGTEHSPAYLSTHCPVRNRGVLWFLELFLVSCSATHRKSQTGHSSELFPFSIE